MPTQRHLRADEIAFLRAMVEGSEQDLEKIDELGSALVEDMDDGSMGSIRFVHGDNRTRELSHALVEAEFYDADGVLVSAALNLDNYGELFELDLWKVNFSKLLRLPEPSRVIMKRK